MQGFQFYSVQFKPIAFAFGTAVVSGYGTAESWSWRIQIWIDWIEF